MESPPASSKQAGASGSDGDGGERRRKRGDALPGPTGDTPPKTVRRCMPLATTQNLGRAASAQRRGA